MISLFLKLIQYILKRAAVRVIKKFDPFVIVITGAVGKSSAKEAVYAVLKSEFGTNVQKSHGNRNNEIGVPLSILGYENPPSSILWPLFLITATFRSFRLRQYPRYLILEYGIDKPGDMAYLASIARPDIAIITSLAGGAATTAHVENFRDLSHYQREKLSLLEYLKPAGKVIINADDSELAKINGQNVKKVGVKTESDYRAEINELSLSGTDFRIICSGKKITVKGKMLGRQMVYPSLFAFAAADLLNVSSLAIGKTLEKIEVLPGRMRLVFGRNNSLIIDDTYNANPVSVKAALDFLAEVDHAGRKVAVLGGMNELGQGASEAHKEVGAYAKDRCDYAFFVGKFAQVLKEGFAGTNCEVLEDRNAAIRKMPSEIRPNDLVLIKASQNGNFLEEIVKTLMRKPEDAHRLLVRQNKNMMKKKHNQR